MKTQRQFVLLLVLLQIAGCAVMAVAAGAFLSHALRQVLTAAQNPILEVMRERVLIKTLITFVAIAVVLAVVSIPAGVLVSRRIALPYLHLLKRFSTLARERLSSADFDPVNRNERRLLEQYAAALVADMENLRDYEKARSWKEGARMLMHELKNPLTPLKLSAQQLMLSPPAEGAHDDARVIIESVGDVERILAMFRNLVNIEFGRKTTEMLLPTVNELLASLRHTGLKFETRCDVRRTDQTALVETTLVKMLLTNLIRNSTEENPDGCRVHLHASETHFVIDVLTEGVTVAEPSQVFKAGYSRKGNGRGFGLFLCRLISDYLDCGIKCVNTSGGALFSVAFGFVPQVQEEGSVL